MTTSTTRWRIATGSAGARCVEVAGFTQTIAMRDSKLDTTGDFPILAVPVDDWLGMIRDIKSGVIPNPHEGACPPPDEAE